MRTLLGLRRDAGVLVVLALGGDQGEGVDPGVGVAVGEPVIIIIIIIIIMISSSLLSLSS